MVSPLWCINLSIVSNICLMQFKVLRGGCWQKINFGRGEAEVNKSDQPCGDLLANPWILHFRSTCKPKDVESPILQEQAAAICEEVDSSLKKEITSAPATCSKQFNVSHSHLMHQDMVGGNTGAFSYILLCFPLIIVGNLCVAIFSYSAAFDWCFGVPRFVSYAICWHNRLSPCIDSD